MAIPPGALTAAQQKGVDPVDWRYPSTPDGLIYRWDGGWFQPMGHEDHRWDREFQSRSVSVDIDDDTALHLAFVALRNCTVTGIRIVATTGTTSVPADPGPEVSMLVEVINATAEETLASHSSLVEGEIEALTAFEPVITGETNLAAGDVLQVQFTAVGDPGPLGEVLVVLETVPR